MLKKRKILGVFSVAMMTAVSVDSVRNLPATALFGSTLIVFFFLAALFFLLPSALIAAELASMDDQHVGVYSWVKQAFGKNFGFLAVWLQWIENVIWYPTILSFVAGTVGYCVSPSLATNKYFLIGIILLVFWTLTLVNLMGIEFSAFVANFCALFGLIVPMLLVIALGLFWWLGGHPRQINFSLSGLVPNLSHKDTWVALTGIILSFCGMEIATVHNAEVNRPQYTYPRALLLSAVLIVVTLIFGSLTIAVVLPEKEIGLVTGIMQAFDAFLKAYHIDYLTEWVAVSLVLGSIGGVNNWIIAPTRGLLFAGREGHLSAHFRKENICGAPQNLLLYQAFIVTAIAMVFFLMPSVNGSYWFLTVLAAQLYMLMYILLFAAGIRLRYLRKSSDRAPGAFMIPGKNNLGMWCIGLFGIIGAATTFFVGFIPPENIKIGSALHYELLLSVGLSVMLLLPSCFFLLQRKS